MAYDKHTWVKGELIDADKMNNIESGIESAVEGAENAVNKTGDTMTGKLTVPSLNINGTDVALPIPMAQGGTGANNATDARTFLNVYSKFEVDALITGGVTPSGDYLPINGGTMTGRLNAPNITAYASTWPGFRFSLNSDGETSLGSVNFDTVNNRIAFISKSNNNTSTREIFHLPASSETDGADHNYEILTTKTVDSTVAETIRTNLAVVAKTGDTMTGNLLIHNGSNYKGLILKGDSSSPTINFYNTGSRLTIDQYANGSTGGERYLLPTPASLSADVWYNIITSKPSTYTLQLKSTNISVTTPADGNLDVIKFLDKDGVQYGYIAGKGTTTDGVIAIEFGAHRAVNSSTIFNNLRLGLKTDGTAVVGIPTTAQTAWRTAIGAVAKTGDTMTGRLTTSGTETGFSTEATISSTNYSIRLAIGATGNRGIYLSDSSKWLIGVNASGDPILGITVPITSGGTGATTAAAARTNLGIGSIATRSIYYSSTTTATPSGGNNGDIYLVKMA